jgi:hypothetical protein
VGSLDDEKNGQLGNGPGINRGPAAQDDPRRNPNGVYSGMAKRVAITDGKFAEIKNMPKDMRRVGRLTHSQISTTDLSRGRLS